MAKNILVITGNPRKNGNTDLLTNAFIKGAQRAGHDVTLFSTTQNRIDGCIGCSNCWKKGTACAFDDGFNTLAPLLEKADTLVLSSPLYWFTFSTYLKAAIDKLHAYCVEHCETKLSIKESLLLMCAAETDTAVFAGVEKTYQQILGYLQWTNRGTLLVPGVYAKGEINQTDALGRAEELGSEL